MEPSRYRTSTQTWLDSIVAKNAPIVEWLEKCWLVAGQQSSGKAAHANIAQLTLDSQTKEPVQAPETPATPTGLMAQLPNELRNCVIALVMASTPLTIHVWNHQTSKIQMSVPRWLLAVSQVCRRSRAHALQAQHEVRVHLRLCDQSLILETLEHDLQSQRLISVAIKLQSTLYLIGPARLARDGLELSIGTLPYALGSNWSQERAQLRDFSKGILTVGYAISMIRRELQSKYKDAVDLTVAVDMSNLSSGHLAACKLEYRPVMILSDRSPLQGYKDFFREIWEGVYAAYMNGVTDTHSHRAAVGESLEIMLQTEDMVRTIFDLPLRSARRKDRECRGPHCVCCASNRD